VFSTGHHVLTHEAFDPERVGRVRGQACSEGRVGPSSCDEPGAAERADVLLVGGDDVVDRFFGEIPLLDQERLDRARPSAAYEEVCWLVSATASHSIIRRVEVALPEVARTEAHSVHVFGILALTPRVSRPSRSSTASGTSSQAATMTP
jgi:hypothetical protein